MGKPKQILRKSINLGEQWEPARILAEAYIRKYGKKSFSEFIRRILVAALSDRPEFKDFKNKMVISESKSIISQIKKLNERREINDKLMKEMGIGDDERMSIWYP